MWPHSDKKMQREETKTEIKEIVLSFGFALGLQLTDLVWWSIVAVPDLFEMPLTSTKRMLNVEVDAPGNSSDKNCQNRVRLRVQT